jgi:phosphoheptose isomerase
MNTRSVISTSLLAGVQTRLQLLAEQGDAITAAADLLRDAVLAGRKVLLCGNGGSASDAQHIAAELVGRFVVERRPLPAIALNTDTSALTAIGNDYGYEHVFSRQVQAHGNAGDVLIAITTSGSSKNVVAAVAAARELGMKVIGLTGAKGGAFVASCDVGIAVPSTNTARIQECHIAVGHVLCEVLDEAFIAKTATAQPEAPRLHPKLYTLPELLSWREACRTRKKTVVWTNGVFDVLHVGHLRSLTEAKRFGDVLIVGVNTDASVRANKGPGRPIYKCEERVELLASLELVDAILVFDDQTPERVLSELKPDVHVKGADYANKPIPERAIVEGYGGRVELIPLVPDRSTTSTLERLKQS